MCIDNSNDCIIWSAGHSDSVLLPVGITQLSEVDFNGHGRH